MRTASLLRVVLRSCRLQLLLRVADPVAYLQMVYQPLVFGLSAVALYAASGQPGRVVYGLVGGALVGMWTVTLFNSAFDMQVERWAGTVELLMGSPTPFGLVMAGKVLTSMAMGLVSTAVFVLLGVTVFHGAFAHVLYPQLVVSALLTLLAFFALGMLVAALFTIARAPGPLANGLEMPALILCGFLFPPNRLPAWTHVASWLLPPSWPVRALYEAAGQAPGPGASIPQAWLAGVLLSAGYLALAAFVYGRLEARTRVTGQLSLL